MPFNSRLNLLFAERPKYYGNVANTLCDYHEHEPTIGQPNAFIALEVEVSLSCAITNVAKIIVKRYLQKGWCEPASGRDNEISDRCESVGVLLSVGGNTSAYLATER